MLKRLLLLPVFLSPFVLIAQIAGQAHFEEFSQGFEFVQSSWSTEGFNSPWVNGFNQQRAYIDSTYRHDGTYSLRILYPDTGVGPTESGAQAPLPIPPKSQYYSSYWLRFSDNFSWGTTSYGGKLPGLAGGANCSGCETCDGTNGFTARLMWRTGGKAVLYLYHMNKVNPCGDNYNLLDKNGNIIYFQPGKWYNIIERVKVNTGSNQDGEVELWVNNEHALLVTGLEFVTNGDQVDNFYFSTFHGGSGAGWEPGVNCHIWFDDIVISENPKDVFPLVCAQANLGPNQSLCGSSNAITLNPNVPSTNRTFSWYKNGILIDTSSTIQVNQAGSYKVVVDSSGCLSSDSIIISSSLYFNLGPDVHLCAPASVNLNSGLGGQGIQFTWMYNNKIMQGVQTPYLNNVRTPGTYILTASESPCPDFSDTVQITSDLPVPHDTCIQSQGTATLSVFGLSTYSWYDSIQGGNLLKASSPTFTTPVISSTTTYYVQDDSSGTGYLGRDKPGAYTYNNQNFSNKFQFDVLQKLTIDSVTVFPSAPGTVVIRILQTDLTTVVGQSQTTVSGGVAQVPVGVTLGPGTYIMDAVGTNVNLKEDQDNGGTQTYAYPYTIPGIISLNATVPSWVISKPWYLYFYHWKITYGKGCNRIPVVAKVGNCGITTAIQNYETQPVFNFYPNPFTDVLYIQGKNLEGQKVRIFNSSGINVLSGVIEKNQVTGAEHLAPGLYYAEVDGENGIQRTKLLKVY